MSEYECYCDKCNVPDGVKYHRKNRKGWDTRLEYIFAKAIRDKKFDCVNNICEEECCKIPNSVANDVASDGNIDGLKFLCSKKMKFGASVLKSAINNDNLECVKYLHSLKCRWTTASVTYAAKLGKFDALAYLVEHGCPCDEEACYWAARGKYWNCVQFLCDHGCLFDVLHTTNDDLSDEQDGYDDPDD